MGEGGETVYCLFLIVFLPLNHDECILAETKYPERFLPPSLLPRASLSLLLFCQLCIVGGARAACRLFLA